MATVVLGSVLIYSFFLPQAAPKQITLAVLPFPEDGEFTPLSVGFTAALRDSIALSRDVAVVDTLSTNAVMWDPEKSSGMSHILAITHFVDGELHGSDGNLERVDFRVVNVSHPNWKEVLNVSGVDFSESETWQDLRDSVTLQVRGALYDNSALRTDEFRYAPETYEAYLVSLGDWLLQHKDSALFSSLHETYQAKTKDLFEMTGIATQPSRELWEAVALFKATQDTGVYSETIWNLAGEYPNSLAVGVLGALAHDLQKLKLAESAWLRVARLQPQSAFAALNIAHVRRLLGDSEGTGQAFRIATLRDDLGIVDYFEMLDEQFHEPNRTSSTRRLNPTKVEALTQASGGFLRGDFLIAASIHTETLRDHSTTAIQTAKLWRSPPLWLREDEPRWTGSRDFLAQHFPTASAAITIQLLPNAESTEAVTQLFAPRRPE